MLAQTSLPSMSSISIQQSVLKNIFSRNIRVKSNALNGLKMIVALSQLDLMVLSSFGNFTPRSFQPMEKRGVAMRRTLSINSSISSANSVTSR